MSNITEYALQAMLDEKFDTMSFLTFEADGVVMYNNENIGTWENAGSTMKVALFIEGDNDPEYFQVTKDIPINKEEEKVMDSKCKALVKGREHGIKASHERDGQPVCKTHLNAKNVTFNEASNVNGALEQGAMNNPENVKAGIARVKSALENNSKEKVMQGISVKEAKKVSEMVDSNKVQQFANELYGTTYGMGQTYIKVSSNSGQAHDSSKQGYIFCGSEYVGRIVKVEGEFNIAFNRGDHSECINISKFNKEDKDMDNNTQEETPVITADVFYCNIWVKDGKTIYYFNQEWKNVTRTRDDFVARAEGVLGNKRNKAIVMKVAGEWVVITKVVKDGQLVTKSVYAETMDLRKNNR